MMSDEIIGECCECKAPCTERDMVGNQIELGFPVLWCNNCINKHLDEDKLNEDTSNRVHNEDVEFPSS